MKEDFKFECFLNEFHRIVEMFPDLMAISSEFENISYSELNLRIMDVSSKVYKMGIRKGDVVVLWMEKSPEYIVLFLALWNIGGVFLPLDEKTPVGRVDWICKDVNAKILIAPEAFCNSECSRGLNLETKIGFAFSVTTLCAQCVRKIKSTELTQMGFNSVTQSSDTAYIIYTSGSTGNPKGVVVPHEGIVNFLKEQIKVFRVKPKSKVLQYLSIGFDASLSEIGISLLSGGQIRIEIEEELKNQESLIEILKKEKITHICLPPSLLPVLAIREIPSSLETIIIGGEVCPVETVREWAKKFRIVNVYGPTEATVCSSLIVCAPNWSKPLIGYPIPNRNFHILDENLSPVKHGDSGELYLSGVGLAKEYWNQKTMTEEKFIVINGARLYKTGDRVVCHNSKEIEFLGRMDRQFKLRGNLIEPFEVERLLSAYPEVTFSHVMKQKLKREILVAYLVLKGNANSKESAMQALKDYLKSRLPYWMIPERFVFLEKIPVNSNEKFDVKFLPLLETNRPLYLPEYKEPRNPTERKLCSIFSELLCIDSIGIEDNFLLLGGDSLSTISILTECSLLGISLSTGKFIQNPTVAGIAGMELDGKGSSSSVKFLEQEAPLGIDLKQAIRNSITVERKVSEILITGATGFLGSRILYELNQTCDTEIYCIVRNALTIDPRTKIEETLCKQGLQISNWKKIHFLEGDISRPKLGLNELDWECLTSKIDAVFHFAAEVNLVLPYESLKQVNVDATREVLKFCVKKTRKTLHYASTLSVFVSSDDPRYTFYEEDELDTMTEVYGGYAQSKWVSEKILHEARKAGFDSIFIYRFGLITGDSNFGYGKKGDFLFRFLKSILDLKIMPNPNAKLQEIKVDITPVDFAAKTCIAISRRADYKGIFHIANPKPLLLSDLMIILFELGIEITEVTAKEFLDKCNSEYASDSYFYLSLCRIFLSKEEFTPIRPLDLFQATGVEFDFSNTKKILPNYDLECPPPDKYLIHKYLGQVQ